MSYRSARLTPVKQIGLQYELGAEVRTHRISQQQNLIQAPQNEIWDQRDDADIRTTDVGVFGDLLISGSKYVRLRGGARADLQFFDVDDKLGNLHPVVLAEDAHRRVSPDGERHRRRSACDARRASRVLAAPLASYGEGFRSPQARQLEEGEQAPFAKVRSYEAGATIRQGDALSVSAIAYQTDLSYDLAFDPGEGRLERIGPTTRRGLVGYLLATPAEWINVSVSATYVHATLDSPPIATPENPSPAFVVGAVAAYVPPLLVRSDVAFARTIGSVLAKPLVWKAGYGTTFLSSRPLPYGQTSPPVFWSTRPSAFRRDWLELSIDGFNILNARYADTEYAFVSNWANIGRALARAGASHHRRSAARAPRQRDPLPMNGLRSLPLLGPGGHLRARGAGLYRGVAGAGRVRRGRGHARQRHAAHRRMDGHALPRRHRARALLFLRRGVRLVDAVRELDQRAHHGERGQRARRPRPPRSAEVNGFSGEIHSASFDFGISWFDTQITPTPAPALPGGHSIHLEGAAVKGAVVVPFVADVDVVPQYQGQNAVSTAPASADVSSSATRLEVVVEPAGWLKQLHFDEIAATVATTGQTPFVIAPGTTEHGAILVG